MPFPVSGLCAALLDLDLNGAPFAGSAGKRRLPSPVAQAAAVRNGLAVLKIRGKLLPAAAPLSIKSP